MKEFELMSHTGDIQMRAHGSTLEQLFANALKGMFAIVSPHPVPSAQAIERAIHVEGRDIPVLLINFLSECLYLSDVHNESYTDAKFDVLTDTQVQATIKGMPITKFEHTEIKAATHHNTRVEKTDGEWQALITFDV